MSYEQVNDSNFEKIKKSIVEKFKSTNFVKRRIKNDFLDVFVSLQEHLTSNLVLENLKNFSFIFEKKIESDESFSNNDFFIRFSLIKRGPKSLDTKEMFGTSKSRGSYKTDEFSEFFDKANKVYIEVYALDPMVLYKSVIAIDSALSLINTSAPKGLTPIDYTLLDFESNDPKILCKRFEVDFLSKLFIKKLMYNRDFVENVEFIFKEDIYEVE